MLKKKLTPPPSGEWATPRSRNHSASRHPDIQRLRDVEPGCYTLNHTGGQLPSQVQSLVRYSTHPTMTGTTSHTLSLKCRVLGREAACTIFNVLGRTRPRIELTTYHTLSEHSTFMLYGGIRWSSWLVYIYLFLLYIQVSTTWPVTASFFLSPVTRGKCLL